MWPTYAMLDEANSCFPWKKSLSGMPQSVDIHYLGGDPATVETKTVRVGYWKIEIETLRGHAIKIAHDLFPGYEPKDFADAMKTSILGDDTTAYCKLTSPHLMFADDYPVSTYFLPTPAPLFKGGPVWDVWHFELEYLQTMYFSYEPLPYNLLASTTTTLYAPSEFAIAAQYMTTAALAVSRRPTTSKTNRMLLPNVKSGVKYSSLYRICFSDRNEATYGVKVMHSDGAITQENGFHLPAHAIPTTLPSGTPIIWRDGNCSRKGSWTIHSDGALTDIKGRHYPALALSVNFPITGGPDENLKHRFAYKCWFNNRWNNGPLISDEEFWPLGSDRNGLHMAPYRNGRRN